MKKIITIFMLASFLLVSCGEKKSETSAPATPEAPKVDTEQMQKDATDAAKSAEADAKDAADKASADAEAAKKDAAKAMEGFGK